MLSKMRMLRYDSVLKKLHFGKIRITYTISDAYDTPISVFWQAIFQVNSQNCRLRQVVVLMASVERMQSVLHVLLFDVCVTSLITCEKNE